MALINLLAEMAAKIRYEDLSNHVVEETKVHILDTFGCAFLGHSLGLYKPYTDIYKEMGGKPESSVIGDRYKIPCVNAAFSNSVMINSADYEDTHRFSVTHPSVDVFPAALAMAEKEQADGKTFIESIVAGYEVLIRIGMAVSPHLMNRGFQGTGVLAPFGASAAAGKILGFNEALMADAISLSANLGSGLIEVHGSLPAKPVQIAKGCQAGVLSALLAQKGIKGCHTILEGGSVNPAGFLQSHAEKHDVQKLTENLGKDYEIAKTAIKIHYGCRYVHAPIDAALGCVQKYKIDLNRIQAIEVRVTSLASNIIIRQPKNEVEARFNIPYVVSIALLEGKVNNFMFTKDRMEDPKIRQLMGKVKVIHDPALDEEHKKTGSHFTSVAEVTTADGKKNVFRVDFPKGEPEYPATKEEAIAKFEALASGMADPERIRKFIGAVNRLETLPRAADLLQIIPG